MLLNNQNLSFKNALNIKKLFFLITITPFIFSCVPLKKQLILQDRSKTTLKDLRKVDTTLFYTSFEYKLKPTDVISVNLISINKGGEYDLSMVGQQGNISSGGQASSSGSQGQQSSGYIVNDSGYVNLPVLGKIKIAGNNLKDAERIIQKQADQLLDNTIVNVRLLSFYVYFLGETNLEGRIYAPRDRLTIIEAISLAGGFKDFADRSHIKIIRNQGLTAHIYYVNLLDQTLITRNEIYLLPNDILIVEPLKAKIIRTYTIPNITLAISSITLLLTVTLALNNLLKN